MPGTDSKEDSEPPNFGSPEKVCLVLFKKLSYANEEGRLDNGLVVVGGGGSDSLPLGYGGLRQPMERPTWRSGATDL